MIFICRRNLCLQKNIYKTIEKKENNLDLKCLEVNVVNVILKKIYNLTI